jgi:hypothetical protein
MVTAVPVMAPPFEANTQVALDGVGTVHSVPAVPLVIPSAAHF